MIGFVGLGLMGEGFTRRLIEKGHAVTGFDIDPEKTRAAAALGRQAGGERRGGRASQRHRADLRDQHGGGRGRDARGRAGSPASTSPAR